MSLSRTATTEALGCIATYMSSRLLLQVLRVLVTICVCIPCNGGICPTVINKSQPIESIGSRPCDHSYTFDSGVRAQFNFCRTSPLQGIPVSKVVVWPMSRQRVHRSLLGYTCHYFPPRKRAHSSVSRIVVRCKDANEDSRCSRNLLGLESNNLFEGSKADRHSELSNPDGIHLRH